MSAAYRVRQFVRAASACIHPKAIEEAPVGRYLPPAAVKLFRAMPRYDQQHALSVFRTLEQGGDNNPDLLAAALLHDVGKTAHPAGRLRLWHRVAIVLVRALEPGLLERLGQEEPGSWRWPFFVQQHHASIGSELARQAGCSSATAALIHCHEDPPTQADDPLLTALQAADGAN